MRKTAGYTWTDYITNREIAKERNSIFGQNTEETGCCIYAACLIIV
jgi:hypothetical protein